MKHYLVCDSNGVDNPYSKIDAESLKDALLKILNTFDEEDLANLLQEDYNLEVIPMDDLPEYEQ